MAAIKRTDEIIKKASETAAKGVRQTQAGETGTSRSSSSQQETSSQQAQASTPQLMGQMRSSYRYTAPKPTYTSPYSDQIDSLLSSILNRDDFSYDVDSDPLYQQYRAQYEREGDRAMRDTLGQAAALTGGYGSSYATTAASQANDYYMSQLNDRVPELYQLAYQQWLNDLNDQYSQLSALQQAENQAYSRYRDQVGDYEADRAFDYGLWGDALSQENWQKQFDYQQAQDALAQQNWQASFDYQKAQDALSQQNWEKEFAYQQEQDALAYALKKAAQASSGSSSWASLADEAAGESLSGTKIVPNPKSKNGRDDPTLTSNAYYQIDNRMGYLQRMENASKADMARELVQIVRSYETQGYEFDLADIEDIASRYDIAEEVDRLLL